MIGRLRARPGNSRCTSTFGPIWSINAPFGPAVRPYCILTTPPQATKTLAPLNLRRNRSRGHFHGERECDTLAQGLIRLIGYSYQQVATSFPEAGLHRTPRLSMLGPEKFGDGDRPGSSFRVRTSEKKVCRKDIY